MDMPADYMDRLRSVFNICDLENQGYISVEHFIDLAQEHFGADAGEHESMKNIINVLDPENDGKIQFPQFCQGVKQILQIRTPTSPTECPSFPPFVHASRDLGSQDTLVAGTDDSIDSENHEAVSEVSTFNEYDIAIDDDVAMASSLTTSSSSSIPPGESSHHHSNGIHEDDRDSAFSAKMSDNQDMRNEFVITDEEEKFEFTGESGFHRVPSPSSSSNGGSRRITSNTLASQLFRVAGSSVASRRSSCSEDIYDDIDSSFIELNDKVHNLESQLRQLQEKQVVSDERAIRMKEDNVGLIERRVHLLEEQLREVEMKSQEKISSEQKKHRELMARTEKDKSQEIELLTMSLQRIEREYEELKDEAPRLRSENERLRKENHILESKVSLFETRLSKLHDDHSELEERVSEERIEMEQERKIHTQLLDELSKELDDLRAFKQHSEGSQSAVRRSSLPRSQRRELEAQIIRLKTENQHLREQCEDLEAQMLSKSVEEGRSLLQAGDSSLADEIQDLPREELMKSLQKEQEANRKLREYVDQIMLRILEKNPSILEINENSAGGKKKK